MQAAARILADVKERGDKAVIDCARLYDGSNISNRRIRVSPEEIVAAKKAVDADFKKAAEEAHKRIVAFSKNGLRDGWRMETPKGGMLGEKFVPFDRVGAYIPGGAAPLASTALAPAIRQSSILWHLAAGRYTTRVTTSTFCIGSTAPSPGFTPPHRAQRRVCRKKNQRRSSSETLSLRAAP